MKGWSLATESSYNVLQKSMLEGAISTVTYRIHKNRHSIEKVVQSTLNHVHHARVFQRRLDGRD